MGFHTGKELPNYWELRETLRPARPHVRSDGLVDAARLTCSWSRDGRRPARTRRPYVVSSDSEAPCSGRESSSMGRMGAPRPLRVGEYHLAPGQGRRELGYYVGQDTCVQRPQCGLPWDSQRRCPPRTRCPASGPCARPGRGQPRQRAVQRRVLRGRATAGSLPCVSWVMPSRGQGEHPSDRIAMGQRWVSRVGERRDGGPRAARTAVFLVWDDWGGFYDHVRPPWVDRERLRAPCAGDPDQPVRRPGLDSTTRCSRSTPS